MPKDTALERNPPTRLGSSDGISIVATGGSASMLAMTGGVSLNGNAGAVVSSSAGAAAVSGLTAALTATTGGVAIKTATTTLFQDTAGATVLSVGQTIPSGATTTVLTLNGTGLEKRANLIDQAVLTTSKPAFVGISFPSTQTPPATVAGKLILTTTAQGDLVGRLPSGKVFPIGGATMPFFSFDETATAYIYAEPSAGLWQLLWDAPSRSAAISFVGGTYFGSTIINISTSILRRTTLSDSAGTASIGYFWGIVPGAACFLVTSSTTAPTGTLQMTSSGMLMTTEFYPNVVSSGGFAWPVCQISIRMGTTGGTCAIRWLYT